MLDINLLRNKLDLVVQGLSVRGFEFDVELFKLLDNQRRELQVETQNLQAQRNKLSSEIGLKKKQGESVDSIMSEVQQISNSLKLIKKAQDEILVKMDEFLSLIPNLPHPDVPHGADESDNVEIKTYLEPKVFDFEIKDHVALGENLQGLDFEKGAALSGSRFVVKHSGVARLHRALAQFMIDTHVDKHAYLETMVPFLVQEEALYGTSQLPKFREDIFFTSFEGSERPLGLIPTSEVPLTNLVADSIIQENDLPLRFTAHTPCFRSEAGSYGRDTRGLIRQHQFEKVEMVQIAHPEYSYKAHDEMLSHAESILQALALPYRVVVLCGGDLGFAATKTYDIEVWVPSADTYREISSISNCEDFQARRMKARFKDQDGQTQYVHTLNGSGLAVGRTLLAVMENYQTADGDIEIPQVLRPYLKNASLISEL